MSLETRNKDIDGLTIMMTSRCSMLWKQCLRVVRWARQCNKQAWFGAANALRHEAYDRWVGVGVPATCAPRAGADSPRGRAAVRGAPITPLAMQSLPDAGLMLGKRRRRWTSIEPTSGEHFVFVKNICGWMNGSMAGQCRRRWPSIWWDLSLRFLLVGGVDVGYCGAARVPAGRGKRGHGE